MSRTTMCITSTIFVLWIALVGVKSTNPLMPIWDLLQEPLPQGHPGQLTTVTATELTDLQDLTYALMVSNIQQAQGVESMMHALTQAEQHYDLVVQMYTPDVVTQILQPLIQNVYAILFAPGA